MQSGATSCRLERGATRITLVSLLLARSSTATHLNQIYVSSPPNEKLSVCF